jgi:hypothetical protein
MTVGDLITYNHRRCRLIDLRRLDRSKEDTRERDGLMRRLILQPSVSIGRHAGLPCSRICPLRRTSSSWMRPLVHRTQVLRTEAAVCRETLGSA